MDSLVRIRLPCWVIDRYIATKFYYITVRLAFTFDIVPGLHAGVVLLGFVVLHSHRSTYSIHHCTRFVYAWINYVYDNVKCLFVYNLAEALVHMFPFFKIRLLAYHMYEQNVRALAAITF